MIGVRIRRMASHLVVRSCFSIETGVAVTKVSLISAPAAKARSLPVSTMQRIAVVVVEGGELLHELVENFFVQRIENVGAIYLDRGDRFFSRRDHAVRHAHLPAP